MSNPSLFKFYNEVQWKARKLGLRYGQAMFNHLNEIRPDLADAIRATDRDPYNTDEPSDPVWDKFISFLEANWFDNQLKVE